MTEQEVNKLPILLKVNEMAKILKIDEISAYKIIYRNNFNMLRISYNKIRIPKYELVRWIKSKTSIYKIEEV